MVESGVTNKDVSDVLERPMDERFLDKRLPTRGETLLSQQPLDSSVGDWLSVLAGMVLLGLAGWFLRGFFNANSAAIRSNW